MAIQLVIMSLDIDSFEQPLTRVFEKEEITLGRDESNDLVLDRPEVSSNHCRIRLKSNGGGTQLYVTDLGSANGTILENRELEPQSEIAIRAHQRIVIGTYLIKPTVLPSTQILKSPETAEPSRDRTASSRAATDITSRSEAHSALLAEAAASMMEESPPQTSSWEAEKPKRQSLGEFFKIEDILKKPGSQASSVRPADPFSLLSDDGLESESLDVPGDEPDLGHLEPAPETADELISEEEVPSGMVFEEQAEAEAPAEESSFPEAGHPEPVSLAEREFSSDGSTGAQGETMETGELGSVRLVVDESTCMDLDFIARKLITLSGKVTHKGRPLAGARISADTLGERTTGEDGLFSFGELPEETLYHCRISKEGYEFDLDGIRSGSLELDTELQFAATQLFDVRGAVIHRGEPLEGVEIDGGPLGRTTTTANGTFVFHNVSEGTAYTLRAEMDKYTFDRGELSGTAGPLDASVAFIAKRLFTLRGRILRNGTPIPGVRVDGGSLGTTTTTEDGTYTFENVPEGAECVLTASKDGYVFGSIRKTPE